VSAAPQVFNAPTSPFRAQIYCVKFTPTVCAIIAAQTLTIVDAAGERSQPLATPADMDEALARHFGLPKDGEIAVGWRGAAAEREATVTRVKALGAGVAALAVAAWLLRISHGQRRLAEAPSAPASGSVGTHGR
jgi:hypothetical protein